MVPPLPAVVSKASSFVFFCDEGHFKSVVCPFALVWPLWRPSRLYLTNIIYIKIIRLSADLVNVLNYIGVNYHESKI